MSLVCKRSLAARRWPWRVETANSRRVGRYLRALACLTAPHQRFASLVLATCDFSRLESDWRVRRRNLLLPGRRACSSHRSIHASLPPRPHPCVRGHRTPNLHVGLRSTPFFRCFRTSRTSSSTRASPRNILSSLSPSATPSSLGFLHGFRVAPPPRAFPCSHPTRNVVSGSPQRGARARTTMLIFLAPFARKSHPKRYGPHKRRAGTRFCHMHHDAPCHAVTYMSSEHRSLRSDSPWMLRHEL